MAKTVLLSDVQFGNEKAITKQPGFFKDYYRFIYLILVSFITGTMVLVAIQYYSSISADRIISGNEKLLKELNVNNHLREVETDILGVESRIRAAIATGDTSHLSGVDLQIHGVQKFLDSLKINSQDQQAVSDIARLQYLVLQKTNAKNLLTNLFRKTGKMRDIHLIANPLAGNTSNEISQLIKNIYDGRQQIMISLSNNIEENGRRARFYGGILVALILLSSTGLAYFIIKRIKRQNKLILQLDISERKTREAALIKENFMANMSHEIRTPLNSILGFANLLKKKQLNSEPMEFVDAIQRSGENLLSIVNDILDFSKIEAGMMRIVSVPFSIRGLVQSIVISFTEKVQLKSLELSWEIGSSIPDTLIGDSSRLGQILVNLIGNALKFTEKGKIVLEVQEENKAGKNINLNFRISDTGIGISQEKVSGIFEYFKQAEDSITRNYGGTGLGLSIVRDLVLLQNGIIEVNSELGRGTTFSFSLKYLIAEDMLPTTVSSDIIINEQKVFSAIHILVVDDNKMNQSLMGHLLTHWDFSFSIVSNGKEAIELLERATYDLILMDIQMPVMDGYSATHFIRTHLKLNLPIIAMTAHAMAGEREKCLDSGMDEYISKPIDEYDLLKLIRRFVTIAPFDESRTGKIISKDQFRYLDLTYMKDISKGNVAYEKKATHQFINVIPQNLTDLEDAFHQENYRLLNLIAHDMKTSVSIVGLTAHLSDTLDFIEKAEATTGLLAEKLVIVNEICTAAVIEAMQFYDSL